MEVFHPITIRSYMRKYDMDEPPKLEEPLDELDNRWKRLQSVGGDQPALEEKFYRLGIHYLVFFFFSKLKYNFVLGMV